MNQFQKALVLFSDPFRPFQETPALSIPRFFVAKFANACVERIGSLLGLFLAPQNLKIPMKTPAAFPLQRSQWKKNTHKITAWDHELNCRVNKWNNVVKHRVVLVNIFNHKMSFTSCNHIQLVGGFNQSILKNMRKSNWIISPEIGMKIKNIWVATNQCLETT